MISFIIVKNIHKIKYEVINFEAWLRICIRNKLNTMSTNTLRRKMDISDKYRIYSFSYDRHSTYRHQSTIYRLALRTCSEKMTPRNRIIFNYKFYRSLSEKEISELLIIPIHTVKYRIKIMRNELSTLLKEELGENYFEEEFTPQESRFVECMKDSSDSRLKESRPIIHKDTLLSFFKKYFNRICLIFGLLLFALILFLLYWKI